MTELTPEQMNQKMNLIGIMGHQYETQFVHFFRKLTLALPTDISVMLDAYGISKEELLLKRINMVLDRWNKSINHKEDPNQLKLFDF